MTKSGMRIQFLVLADIDCLLKSLGKRLKDYPSLPQPPSIYLNVQSNNLIIDETNYDRPSMTAENEALLSQCNKEQLDVYHEVVHAVEKNEEHAFSILANDFPVEHRKRLSDFADWVLAIGDGNVKLANSDTKQSNEYEIDIPVEYR
ncbi:hypothetical protein POM88_038545 [Heracleum sosnowskyi]|uniref:Uncharacterized protein n=1 Tax=Heracleum sosnowskyi TaxID=360622 RepID=A0AAD8HAV7_9APIA|nr:hypothetical protein POM88_038545 [Heracleum sosnowskyi]